MQISSFDDIRTSLRCFWIFDILGIVAINILLEFLKCYLFHFIGYNASSNYQCLDRVLFQKMFFLYFRNGFNFGCFNSSQIADLAQDWKQNRRIFQVRKYVLQIVLRIIFSRNVTNDYTTVMKETATGCKDHPIRTGSIYVWMGGVILWKSSFDSCVIFFKHAIKWSHIDSQQKLAIFNLYFSHFF